MSAWKQFERESAACFDGRRFWANSGERLDFVGTVGDQPVRGQCKLGRVLSLEALTKLAEEPGVDLVCVKVRRGAGRPSPALIVFTAESYRRLHPRADDPDVPSEPRDALRATARRPHTTHPQVRNPL